MGCDWLCLSFIINSKQLKHKNKNKLHQHITLITNSVPQNIQYTIKGARIKALSFSCKNQNEYKNPKQFYILAASEKVLKKENSVVPKWRIPFLKKHQKPKYIPQHCYIKHGKKQNRQIKTVIRVSVVLKNYNRQWKKKTLKDTESGLRWPFLNYQGHWFQCIAK